MGQFLFLCGHQELSPAGSSGNSVGREAGVWTRALPGCGWLRAAACWEGDRPHGTSTVLLPGRMGWQGQRQPAGRLTGVRTKRPCPARRAEEGMGWGCWLTAEATGPPPPDPSAAPYGLLGDVTPWAWPTASLHTVLRSANVFCAAAENRHFRLRGPRKVSL